MLRKAQLPFAHRLEWLEEAHEMILTLQAQQPDAELQQENRENREEA
jgi:hypothetical protein